MNIAGGTHHAFKDRGEAFCMLNDQAIAANYLIKNNKAKIKFLSNFSNTLITLSTGSLLMISLIFNL